MRQTVGVDLDGDYRPLRNQGNRFWQDRQAMKAGNFTGISGFPNQDVAMWVTMGPITDRTTERLGSSDLAIVTFRRQMVAAAQAVQAGKAAIGTAPDCAEQACAFQAMVPKTADWRTHPAQPVWPHGNEARQDRAPSAACTEEV